MKLYSFVDNHDVDRIASKLQDQACLIPVHALLYFLPGIPSVYYGSEFGISGRKEGGNDAPLRPALSLKELEKKRRIRNWQSGSGRCQRSAGNTRHVRREDIGSFF